METTTTCLLVTLTLSQPTIYDTLSASPTSVSIALHEAIIQGKIQRGDRLIPNPPRRENITSILSNPYCLLPYPTFKEYASTGFGIILLVRAC